MKPVRALLRLSGTAFLVVCSLIPLSISNVAWAADEGTALDANKPLVNGSIPLTDLSCWMASAANMMAADDWARIAGQDGQTLANQTFTDLRSAFGVTVGGKYRSNGGFQNQAINYYNRKYRLDLDEQVDVWSSWNQNAWQGRVAGWDTSPQVLIDNLLGTTTAGPPPNEGPPTEGPDDPIGIGFQSVDANGNIQWGRGAIAHAVTIWADANGQLTVTDSDDAVAGTQTYQWVNGSKSDFIYNGRRVRITYICFLADSVLNVGRPDTFFRPRGFGATSENDPTFTANFVPEPAFYQLGALLALGGLGALRMRRQA